MTLDIPIPIQAHTSTYIWSTTHIFSKVNGKLGIISWLLFHRKIRYHNLVTSQSYSLKKELLYVLVMIILLEMLNCGFFFHLLKILHKQLFLSKFQCSRNNFPKQNINFVLIDVIKMKVCYFKSNLVTNPIWTVASKCIKLHLYFYSMLPVKCQSVFHSSMSYKNYTSFSVLFGFSDNVKEKYLSFTLSRKVVWGFFHEWND